MRALKKGEFRCRGVARRGRGEGRAGARPSAASLVVHEDGESRTVVLAGRRVTIGRLPECQVDDRRQGRVSAARADPPANGRLVHLTDLGSTNGTRLNGQTIQTRELADGDRITIGATLLEFREGLDVTPFALSALEVRPASRCSSSSCGARCGGRCGDSRVEPSPSGRKARKTGGTPSPRRRVRQPSSCIRPEGKAAHDQARAEHDDRARARVRAADRRHVRVLSSTRASSARTAPGTSRTSARRTARS